MGTNTEKLLTIEKKLDDLMERVLKNKRETIIELDKLKEKVVVK